MEVWSDVTRLVHKFGGGLLLTGMLIISFLCAERVFVPLRLFHFHITRLVGRHYALSVIFGVISAVALVAILQQVWNYVCEIFLSHYDKDRIFLYTVRHSQGVAESLIQDVQEFLDSAAWYQRKNVPYRRIYLFHGPTGTGKTRFIMALAGYFNRSVCLLNLRDGTLTDNVLLRLMDDAPADAVILMENVDTAFGDPEGVGLAVLRLLNALDVGQLKNGRLIFLTANRLDRVAAALISPQHTHIDHYQLFDYVTVYQVEQMYRRFHRQCTDDQVQQFLKTVFDRPEPKISPAQLQALFISYKRNPAEVIQGVSALFS
ncbi:mitochondrial chaperone BCS1-like [Paramacrobiotus metropolitanus]|uniref:mitochondrial chaperone BCS1-like n=1 Tax=Paramacrobiotus metropolitanus TaxID=2943436 RepID=UPI002445C50D|nr:mitochondrial chaperone BCS1-like [Paramacrobiotus metropolitanus]